MGLRFGNRRVLISIFDVDFASSFNTPALIASLATEHSMLPSWIGKKNKHDAAWVAILFSAVISAILITQSYLFLVSCIVLASFVQYVSSILAVIKFKHTNEFPNHGFKLPGGYTIPILALMISCYMVTNFTWKTILVGVVVGVLAAVAYFFIEKDEKAEQKHQQYLAKMRQKYIKTIRRKVSVSDALQLMLEFGSFVVTLITLVVELIKFYDQRKK
ncbi:amino acid permease [Lactobacillus crispatus]|uniref:Amino acid permease n=1 Tax=Lactobacillus crispatus TaxID=47770 RepID=A0A7H9EAD1_9LACO|nr:amino acid permease [Lactobacillus crispatus]